MRRASRFTGPDSAIARNVATTSQEMGCHSSRTRTSTPTIISTISTHIIPARRKEYRSSRSHGMPWDRVLLDVLGSMTIASSKWDAGARRNYAANRYEIRNG